MKPYLLCATPRSGGGLLSSYLKSTNLVGSPAEWLRKQWVSKYGGIHDGSLMRRTDAEVLTLFDKIKKASQTPNGRWGIRVHFREFFCVYRYLRLVGEPFQNYRWIYLSRHDKIRQAISWAKAIQTLQYTRDSEDVPVNDDVNITEYQVERELLHLMAQEWGWHAFFQKHNLKPYCIFYEDYANIPTADLPAIIKPILNHLGVPNQTLPPISTWMHKTSTNFNEKIYRRFIREYPIFLEQFGFLMPNQKEPQ